MAVVDKVQFIGAYNRYNLIRYNQKLDGVNVPGELKGHISLLR